MVDTIKKMCDKARVKPIVILKTPHAGQIVDNNRGMDFELAEWAVLFKKTSKEIDNLVFDFEYGSLHPEEQRVNIQKFDVERATSLEGLVQELKSTDAYDVVWRDDTYKDPERIEATLTRAGVGFKVMSTKWYKVAVTYQEIQKHTVNFIDNISAEDILLAILRDHPDFERIVYNSGFPRDAMIRAYNFIEFTKDGVVYNFGYEKEAAANFERTEKKRRMGLTAAEANQITKEFEENGIEDITVKYVEQLCSFDKRKNGKEL